MGIKRSGRTRGRWGWRIALSLTTILASSFAEPSMAQLVMSPHPNLDSNGVDVTTGFATIGVPIASVGSGENALPLIAYGGRSDNYHILFQASGGNYTVTLGDNYVDNFTSASATSTRGTGATLSGSGGFWTYTMTDGTQIEFVNTVADTGGHSNYCDDYNTSGCLILPSSITRGDGMTINFDWEVNSDCEFNVDTLEDDCTNYGRLSDVINSAGYKIAWAYSTSWPYGGWDEHTSATLYHGTTSTGTVTYSLVSLTGYVYDITTPGGSTWRMAGLPGSITAVRRPGATSDTTTVTYAGYPSFVVSSVTRDGVTTGYSRSVSGTTATMTVTDALSNVTTIVSDLNKFRVTSVTNPLSKVTSYTYDSAGRLTQIAYPETNEVQYTFDGRSNLTETRLKAKTGSGLSDIVTTATFNSDTSCTNLLTCHKPIATTDVLGNETDYSYDGSTGQITKVTLPIATSGGKHPETRYSYTTDADGVSQVTNVSQCMTGATTDSPSCVGTSDEIKTTITYGTGTVTTTTAAGDNSISSTRVSSYDDAGDLIGVDGPLSGSDDTTTYRYDADRRRVGEISPDPDGSGSLKRRAVKTSYNADGTVAEVEVGTVTGTDDTAWAAFTSLQQATSSYDSNARKTKDVVTASSTTFGVTQYSYDADGRLQCTAVRMNSSAWGSLPSDACTLQTAGSYGNDRITKATYDAASQTTKIQTGYAVTGVQADEVTASYTDNGKQATVTDAEGNKTSYTYDGFDRVAKVAYPSTTKGAGTSSSTDYEEFVFGSANNNLTSHHLRGYSGDSSKLINYNYDYVGRITTKTLPNSEPAVTYTYDLLGRMTGASQTGNALTFTYDALGNNKTQVGPLGTVTYDYDVAGRRTKMTWPDSFYINYDYQVTGEVTKVRENGATSGLGVLATYAYDDLGRQTSLTRGNGTVTSYTFDNVSRLASLAHNLDGSTTTNDVTTSFTYSPASEIASQVRTNDNYAWGGSVDVARAYTSNGLNQLTASGSTSLGYDARGNLNSSGSNSYSYSSENLMTGAPSSVTLAYDPALRLYQTVGSTTTRFQYDGTNMIGEYNSSNVLQKRYVFGPGTDEPLVEYAGSGTGSGIRTFLHADERGSVVARSNESGATTGINSYDEYGIPASGNVGRFQYTGQTYLPEIGMDYYKARIYSPTLGRFMQTDPIGYGDGLNMNAYTHNNPVNGTDPSGKKLIWNCVGYADNPNPPCGWTDDGTGDSLAFYFDDNPFADSWNGNSFYLDNVQLAAVPIIPPKPLTIRPQNKPLLDRCGAGYQAADWALWGLGLAGSAVEVVGIFTLQPELVGAGALLNKGATLGSAALHASAGDGNALAGDVAGAVAGIVPGGGTLMRNAGIDISRNIAGRFLPGQAAKYAAQNAAAKAAQEQAASGLAGSQGGCHVKQ